jgi:ParB/RepB/Spo0J family partition protein
MIQAEMSAVEKLGEVILVPRHSIRPFSDQPRKYFDQQKLVELATSIRAIGQKVPGLVKEIDDGCSQKYELIDGQRRWHALAMACVDKMKVIVTEVKNVEDQFLTSVVANFGRAEHGPLEIANAIRRFRDNGMSVSQIAEVFARSDAWVYQHLKVFQLDPEVQKMMSPEIPENCRLLFSVALMLADVPMDLQKNIAEIILGGKLKLVQAKNLIRRRVEKLGFKVGSPDRSPRKDYQNLRSFIGRLRRELGVFDEMPQTFFDKMFQFRDDEDHTKVVVSMQKSLDGARSLLAAIKRAKKNKAPRYARPASRSLPGPR